MREGCWSRLAASWPLAAGAGGALGAPPQGAPPPLRGCETQVAACGQAHGGRARVRAAAEPVARASGGGFSCEQRARTRGGLRAAPQLNAAASVGSQALHAGSRDRLASAPNN